MVSQEKREVGGWWIWITVLLLASVVLFGGARMVGLVGETAIERAVFTNSYQKAASDSQQARTWRAQLAEIDTRLTGMAADDPARAGLEAQRSAISVQLRALEAQ